MMEAERNLLSVVFFYLKNGTMEKVQNTCQFKGISVFCIVMRDTEFVIL
jgi:hypothetical protein